MRAFIDCNPHMIGRIHSSPRLLLQIDVATARILFPDGHFNIGVKTKPSASTPGFLPSSRGAEDEDVQRFNLG